MELDLIFEAIQIAKSFYDHGRFDAFTRAFPRHILREDSFYEFIDTAMDIVSDFHRFNQKQDPEYDMISYYHYFSSENMTAYSDGYAAGKDAHKNGQGSAVVRG